VDQFMIKGLVSQASHCTCQISLVEQHSFKELSEPHIWKICLDLYALHNMYKTMTSFQYQATSASFSLIFM